MLKTGSPDLKFRSLVWCLAAITHDEREEEDVDDEDDCEHDHVFEHALADVAAKHVALGFIRAGSPAEHLAAIHAL
eukprot:CAMPEP_0170468028 /NCGR_PEP_ID=MMETSP0123-20130129/11370_1 /TAXON_ID=182087 /ORGANISM="Favella ehrenbergii, Strain Fehren 1" /LENGTH=75 /DNA_ID=CAMNT_0010734511 /DNA_START=98 /DNA_END=325 /DNA_ORIENTATION=-